MNDTPNDRLAEYLRRDERFDDASRWFRPQRVDAPNIVGPQEADENLLDRDDLRFTDFMVFAWPAQLSRSFPDQRDLWNIAERLVVQARLRATALPPHPVEDLNQEIRKLSSDATPPLDRVLLDCWDATTAMLYPQDSVTDYFPLGRLFSAYAACPGWGIALDIALCADWITFTGHDVFGITQSLWRGAFQQIGDHDGAPSSVYLQAMLAELEATHGAAAHGELACEAAIALARRSVDSPEHPWIEFYLGDQLLCSTHIDELQDDTSGHSWPLRVLYESEPPELGSFRSVIAPIYAFPDEDVTPEVEEQRSFGDAFGQRSLMGSFGPFPLLPRDVGLDCAYTAFGRAYLANGRQPGGPDDVLAVNAAAALVWLGALLPRQDLLECASLTLLERLAAAGIEPGSIPELERATELATMRDLSRLNPKGTTVVLDARLVSNAVQISSIRKDLAEAEMLRAGEEPLDSERVSANIRELVQAQIEEFAWFPFCTWPARLNIEDALYDKATKRRAEIWASRLSVALEEMARHWIEPLRETAMAKGRSTLDLGYKQPDNVRNLRDKFTLGKMKELVECWCDGKLRDEVVLAFLRSRSNRIRKAHRRLVTRAAELRNPAIHAGPFGDAQALELEDVAFKLFPLLVRGAAR